MWFMWSLPCDRLLRRPLGRARHHWSAIWRPPLRLQCCGLTVRLVSWSRAPPSTARSKKSTSHSTRNFIGNGIGEPPKNRSVFCSSGAQQAEQRMCRDHDEVAVDITPKEVRLGVRRDLCCNYCYPERGHCHNSLEWPTGLPKPISCRRQH